MIEVYESNAVSDIMSGKKEIEDINYWPNKWTKSDSIGRYLEEIMRERYISSYEEVSKGLFIIFIITNNTDKDYYYVSENPEKIYKQIKIDKIDRL